VPKRAGRSLSLRLAAVPPCATKKKKNACAVAHAAASHARPHVGAGSRRQHRTGAAAPSCYLGTPIETLPLVAPLCRLLLCSTHHRRPHHVTSQHQSTRGRIHTSRYRTTPKKKKSEAHRFAPTCMLSQSRSPLAFSSLVLDTSCDRHRPRPHLLVYFQLERSARQARRKGADASFPSYVSSALQSSPLLVLYYLIRITTTAVADRHTLLARLDHSPSLLFRLPRAGQSSLARRHFLQDLAAGVRGSRRRQSAARSIKAAAKGRASGRSGTVAVFSGTLSPSPSPSTKAAASSRSEIPPSFSSPPSLS